MARISKIPSTSVNGTVSAPSYSFESDTNTGMYREGADVLGFSAGGTVRAIIRSLGLYVWGGVNAEGPILGQGEVAHRNGTSRSTSMMDLEVLSWM